MATENTITNENSNVIPLVPFYHLNAKYMIDPEAGAEDLYNDATCFLASIRALVNTMTKDDKCDPNLFTIEMLARMALSSLETAENSIHDAMRAAQ